MPKISCDLRGQDEDYKEKHLRSLKVWNCFNLQIKSCASDL